jgi:hypothetical protein
MSTDPLDGVEPGDSVTIDYEKTIRGINITPVGHHGGDRESRIEMTSIKRIEKPREGDYDDIRVCWREEVTKQLPMHLHDDPIDLEAYRRRKRIKEAADSTPDIPAWVSRALNLTIASSVALGVTWNVGQELDSSMTINGELVSFDPSAFVPVVAITLFLAFVVFTLPYLPRRMNAGGMRL